jgi:orotidine-5'-phosphate decarboxylase
LQTFAFAVLEAAVGRAAAIKPQVSFFERHGSRGFAVLESFAERAATADIQVIMDAKRGDIGSTMDGYFDAWLSRTAPFLCDALTVSPYLGFESLNDVMSNALENGKGLFVLAATSNPEGKSTQRAKFEEQTIAANIWNKLEVVNQINADPRAKLGSFGAVVGATLNLHAFGLSNIQTEQSLITPILAPGFGAQGAMLSEVRELFGNSANRVLASVSRSILSAGASQIGAAIDQANAELTAGLKHG